MSHIASARAWVMMEKYTPLIRLRKAKNPKTKAKRTGTARARTMATGKWRKGPQNHGSVFTWFHTMKSGRALP